MVILVHLFKQRFTYVHNHFLHKMNNDLVPKDEFLHWIANFLA